MIGLVWSEGHTTALKIGNGTTIPVQREGKGRKFLTLRADEKKYILIPVVENRVLNKTST